MHLAPPLDVTTVLQYPPQVPAAILLHEPQLSKALRIRGRQDSNQLGDVGMVALTKNRYLPQCTAGICGGCEYIFYYFNCHSRKVIKS